MREAHAFLRRGVVYLHAMSRTTHGPWIRWPPFVRVAWDDQDASRELGDAVTKVLEGSRQGVAHPSDWARADADGFYELAGVSSCGKFVAGDCKLISIEARDLDIQILPQEKRDIGKASVHFVDGGEAIACSQLEELDWKSLLSTAFDRCRESDA